jgi:hypothetical protein
VCGSFDISCKKSMVPVAPFDRSFEMARHRGTSVEGPHNRGSGHCNKPADIEFVMGISVQCIEATEEHCRSEHRQQFCQSRKIVLVSMSRHVQFAMCKGQAMDRFARSTRRKPTKSKHCLTSSLPFVSTEMRSHVRPI